MKREPSKDTENKVDYAPGTYGCHEALDRCSLFAEMIAEFADHPGITRNPEWRKKASQAADILMDLYQEIGATHLPSTGGADKLSFWGMHDNHTFKRYKPKSVDDLIDQWRRDLAEDEPISLCPVTVLSGETEIRRVGEMLHPDYQRKIPKDEDAVRIFKRDLTSDPDIRRLLSSRSG